MKKYLRIIIMMFLCIVNINVVKAYTSTNEECEANGTCLLLCNYYNKIYVSNNKSVTKIDSVSIYYHFKNQKYSLEWKSDRGGATKQNTVISKLFTNSVFSKKVYVTGGVQISDSDFRCPTYAYIDYGNYGGNELCFDNDGASCSRNYNDTFTKFGTAYKLFIAGARDYNIVEQIDTYFKESPYRDLKCEEIFDFSNPNSEKLLINQNDFNEDIWKDFDDNFLHGQKGPSYLETYKANRSSDLFNSLKNRKTECEAEAKKLYDEDKLTDDEYNNRLQAMDGINWNDVEEEIIIAYEDYLDGIRYTLQEQFGDAGNVTIPDIGTIEGMDICSENGVKLTLHVVGYILFAAKLLVPILLIIFGSIDFGKALMDSDDKAIKDASAKLIKRIIAGIIIFFLPTIFNFAFSLIDDVSDNQKSFEQCSKCLFTPFSGECSYSRMGE